MLKKTTVALSWFLTCLVLSSAIAFFAVNVCTVWSYTPYNDVSVREISRETGEPSLVNRIVFVNDGGLYSIKLDGTDLTRIMLADFRGAVSGDAVVSPDGSQIVFIGYLGDDEKTDTHYLYRCTVEGETVVKLGNIAMGCQTAYLAEFNIDAFGKYVLMYYWTQQGGGKNFLINMVTGGREEFRRKTTGFAGEESWKAYFCPQLIGDGKWFIFTDSNARDAIIGFKYLKTGDEFEFYKVYGICITDIYPSPDAKKIIFTGGKSTAASHDSGEYDGSDIYLIDLIESNLKKLTKNSGYNTNPVFSADGSNIAFVSNRDGGYGEIYIMNSDGSGQKRLTTGGGTSPSFSPMFINGKLVSARDYWEKSAITLIEGCRINNVSPPNANKDGTKASSETGAGGTYFEIFKKQLEGAKQTTCTTCEGKGYIYVEGNKIDCWACGGKGYIQIIE